MPLAPEYLAMFEQLAQQDPAPPIYELSTEDARALYRGMRPVVAELPVHAHKDLTIAGSQGEIPIRIYTPEGDGPFGILVNFHGGGWVIGDLDTADAICRQMATLAGVIVVSVDYRIAPEAPYPAAVIDAYEATQWVADHMNELNGNGKLGVTGESAGGNLAAVVSLKARDTGGPKINFQCLLYPVTDCDLERSSYRDNGEGYILETKTMQWFWDSYCPDPTQRGDAYASPLRAEDLSHLPPALIITAEFDPLRDEGAAYGDALDAAGTEATVLMCEGLVHDFMAMAAVFECAKGPLQTTISALKQHLN